MSKDFIKGIIVGIMGFWTYGSYKLCESKTKEIKELKEIIENKDEKEA